MSVSRTDLEIFNAARDRLGLPPVATTLGTDKYSQTMRRRLPEIVKAAFEKATFDFTMRREALVLNADFLDADGETKSVSHGFVYSKPGWCLRVKDYSTTGSDRGIVSRGWRVERGNIHANYSPLYIIGVDIEAVQDYAAWPQTFADYIGLKLAEVSCVGTEDREKLSDIMKEAKAAWSETLLVDAQQGPMEVQSEGAWSRARRGGSVDGRMEDGVSTDGAGITVDGDGLILE